jgi:hypothetical protein
MAFPSFGNSGWMNPCARSTTTAFHFMAVANGHAESQSRQVLYRAESVCKVALIFRHVLPLRDEAHLEPLNLQFVLSRRVLLDLVMEAGGVDPPPSHMHAGWMVSATKTPTSSAPSQDRPF